MTTHSIPAKSNFLKMLKYFIGIYLLAGAAHAAQPPADGKDEIYQILQEQYQLNSDPALQGYINRIAQQIVFASKARTTYKSTIIINTPEIIASTNYHYIFLSTGLIALLSNEAELAAIIGHEVAHIVSDHKAKGAQVLEQLSQFYKENTAGNANAITDELSGAYVLLEIQRNRREFETEADTAAILYMLSGNYDPYAYLSALRKVELTIDDSFEKTSVQNKIISELLSTHPPIHTRLESIQSLLIRYRTQNLTYQNYSERFQHSTNGMTLFSEQSANTHTRYILKYSEREKWQALPGKDQLEKYTLLINQVESLDELATRDKIKHIVQTRNKK